MILLSELKIGEIGIIKKVDSDLHRLLEMGLIPGSEIKLIRKAPVGDPFEFEIKNYSLSLRKEECQKIEVEIRE
ncbi:MAG: ferrous iron transport protein A [Candidatus Lokiarchaeota archaeon]|nr:ferrous iron transport protein A [Candidatus Harpocratesius repetitus]